VRDEPTQVTAIVRQELEAGRARVIVTTGGTGITSRDGTFEAIDGLLEKRLDEFGELFRMLSSELGHVIHQLNR
jgi:molybdopterin adenylyltransferase